MNLCGKKIVLIGGSSGIGLATASLLSEQGAEIVVSCRTAERIDDLRRSLPQAEGVQLDVTNESSVQEFFRRTGPFDHLVYTAGDKLVLSPVSRISAEQVRAFFSVRYMGVFLCMKYGQPLIRNGGSITLTSGMSARRPKKDWSVVASVCGAIESFGKALAVDLAPLRVNVICPGLVDSPLWRNLSSPDKENMYSRAEQALLVGRVATPEDIAQAYFFAITNTFSTGTVMVVDGGASRASA